MSSKAGWGCAGAPLSNLSSFLSLVLYASNVNPEQSFYTLEPLPKEVVLNIFSTFKDILSYPIDDAKIVIVCGHNNIFRIKKKEKCASFDIYQFAQAFPFCAIVARLPYCSIHLPGLAGVGGSVAPGR